MGGISRGTRRLTFVNRRRDRRGDDTAFEPFTTERLVPGRYEITVHAFKPLRNAKRTFRRRPHWIGTTTVEVSVNMSPALLSSRAYVGAPDMSATVKRDRLKTCSKSVFAAQPFVHPRGPVETRGHRAHHVDGARE